MKKTLIYVLILFLFCNYPIIVLAKRVSLVIGNGDYQENPLRNPVNDANDIAKTLKQLQFEVIKITNANLRKMEKALDHFSNNLQRGDVALFFYAGHGIQHNGENYLLPVDARIKEVSDIRYESLNLGKILGRMEIARSMNIIILDACRNNPLGRGFTRSYERGLAVVSHKPEGSIIAYATAPNKTAADGTGSNGLFTSALLKHIATPSLEIAMLFRKVRVDVKKKSFSKQIPWSESSLTDSFYLKKSKEKVKISNKSKLPSRIDKETVFWQSIEDSGNIAEFKAYLAQFPKGTFASLARLNIKKLRKDKKTVASFPSEIFEPKLAKMYVGTEPKNAIIKILNIKPKFEQGIELKPGKYLLKVSKNGYETKKIWVSIADQDKSVYINLLKNKHEEKDKKILNSPSRRKPRRKPRLPPRRRESIFD